MRSCLWGLSKARACAQCSIHPEDLANFSIPSANPKPLLLSLRFFAIFAPAVAKVYIVSFRSNDDRRPSKFIVLADSMKSAIKMAWEHGGADFQSRFDKSTAHRVL